MLRKTFWLAVSLSLSVLTVPAHATDAAPAAPTRIHDSSKKDDGRFTIVNMTQNQIVGTQIGEAATVALAHPIGPGESGQIDMTVTAKSCGPTVIVVTFDDDTNAEGSVDLCTVRKLTLHGEAIAQ